MRRCSTFLVLLVACGITCAPDVRAQSLPSPAYMQVAALAKHSAHGQVTDSGCDGVFQNILHGAQGEKSEEEWLLVEQYCHQWDASTWINDYSIHISHDARGNETEKVQKVWDGGQWVSDSRRTYSYDDRDNLTERIYQHWDGAKWVTEIRYLSSYDDRGEQIEWVKQDLHPDGEWHNRWRYLYFYDTRGQRIEALHADWDWATGAWDDHIRWQYRYDIHGYEIEFLIQHLEAGEWINNQRSLYTYDTRGNRLGELLQRWRDGRWTDYRRKQYHFDTNDNTSESLWQYWVSGEWVNFRTYQYGYDEHGNRTLSHRQDWDGEQWISFSYCIYTYQHEVAVAVSRDSGFPISFRLDQNYPNPFNPQTKIPFVLPSPCNVSLTVYNALGHEVIRLVEAEMPAGRHEVVFDGSALNSGVYLYSVSVDGLSAAKSMLLVK